jgi:type I restriction enzyme S subunit
MNKYPKYKSSGVEWIGEIPEHWNLIRLKNEYKIQKGRIPKIVFEDYSDGLVPYLSMDVLRGSETNDFVSIDDGVYVNNGQVLILWDGSNSGEIIKVDKEGILSSTMGVMNKIGDRLNEDFSYYQLKSYEPEIRNNTNGMGIPHVDGSYVRSLSLFVPPHTEQQQIVQFLDEKTDVIDKLISTKERKIELLKQQRTSLINEVITKGLNPKVKMKDSGVEWIGEIPEHWVVKKMKYFVKICNGSDYKDFVLENGGFPVYGTGGIFSRCSKFLYDKSSVLLGRKGSVDRPQFVNEPFWTSDTTYYTQIKENVSPMYFFHLVKQIQFDQYVYGSAIPSMTKSVYDDMLFPYPPIQEQEQIVKHLDNLTKEIDELVSMEQNKIDLLKEYRQSLISEVITGKIDVRTNPN